MNSDPAREHYILLFGVRRSIRYHTRRRMFFETVHNWATFLSVIAGTATVTAAISEAGKFTTSIFAVLVAIFSAADLVIGTSRQARLHNDLANRFIDLEKELIRIKDPSVEDIALLTEKRLDVEANEPPVLRILDMICHNELTRAMGLDESHTVKIKWYQRLCCNFCDVLDQKIYPKAS